MTCYYEYVCRIHDFKTSEPEEAKAHLKEHEPLSAPLPLVAY